MSNDGTITPAYVFYPHIPTNDKVYKTVDLALIKLTCRIFLYAAKPLHHDQGKLAKLLTAIFKARLQKKYSSVFCQFKFVQEVLLILLSAVAALSMATDGVDAVIDAANKPEEDYKAERTATSPDVQVTPGLEGGTRTQETEANAGPFVFPGYGYPPGAPVFLAPYPPPLFRSAAAPVPAGPQFPYGFFYYPAEFPAARGISADASANLGPLS